MPSSPYRRQNDHSVSSKSARAPRAHPEHLGGVDNLSIAWPSKWKDAFKGKRPPYTGVVIGWDSYPSWMRPSYEKVDIPIQPQSILLGSMVSKKTFQMMKKVTKVLNAIPVCRTNQVHIKTAVRKDMSWASEIGPLRHRKQGQGARWDLRTM